MRQASRWAAPLAMLVFGLMTMPILARHGFDLSALIHAGSRYVDPANLTSPILVAPGADGYDGQFYYRLALAPFDLHPKAFGITLDSPPWRMQRILYPLLAWGVSFGTAAFVPVALFAVNLLGLAAVAFFAVRLTRRLELSAVTPLAVLLWPGFFVALSHDTTEIVATAFLVAALDAYFAGRLALYAALGVLATLTRETSILVFGGIVCFEIAPLLRRLAPASWRRLLICGVAPVSFLAWREAMNLLWGQTPQAGGAGNIGWPLVGAATMLRDTIFGGRVFVLAHGLNIAITTYVAGSAIWLLSVCAIVTARTPAVLKQPAVGALAAGWLPLAALMSLLTAGGPWIDPTGYFRAFTECYVVGCLVLGVRPMPKWLRWTLIAGAAVSLICAWVLAVGER